jgi:hypothetical protein
VQVTSTGRRQARPGTFAVLFIEEKNADQIAKLREYCQALISAAVTGKLTIPREVP